MTAQNIDKLLTRAADNISAAQGARQRGKPELALGNIACARAICAAILDAHHAVDGQTTSSTKTQNSPV